MCVYIMHNSCSCVCISHHSARIEQMCVLIKTWETTTTTTKTTTIIESTKKKNSIYTQTRCHTVDIVFVWLAHDRVRKGDSAKKVQNLLIIIIVGHNKWSENTIDYVSSDCATQTILCVLLIDDDKEKGNNDNDNDEKYKSHEPIAIPIPV